MDYNYAKLLCLAVDQQNIQIIEQILIIKKKFNKILIQSCFKNACIKGYIDVIKIIITPLKNLIYLFYIELFINHLKYFLVN